MVVDKRIVFRPKDIGVVRFVCRKCGNEAAWNPKSEQSHPPHECPFCETRWQREHGGLWETVRTLRRVLSFTSREPDDESFEVRFEIEDRGGCT